jgi:hypothetical protein
VIRQRVPQRAPWPFGNDTPADRARTYAQFCWAELERHAPVEAERIRAMAERFGDDLWLVPQPDTTPPGELMTRAQVAELAGVVPDVVSMWGNRGIVRGGVRYRLQRHPGGYKPDDVTAFLRIRDTPEGASVPAEAST